MTEEIKKRFTELKVVGERSVMSAEEKAQKDKMLIEFLENTVLSDKTASFEDIGFYYWNISDNYAFLRNGNRLYLNHTKFRDYLSYDKKEYLYWLCTDATQRFTLEKSGYTDFWWDLYREALNGGFSDAEFYAHRTALAINPLLPHTLKNVYCTLGAVDGFLKRRAEDKAFDFYNALFHIQKSRLTNEFDNIFEMSVPFADKFGTESSITKNAFLVGEWKSFTEPVAEKRQATLVINTAVNTLIRADRKCEAKELYELSVRHGMSENQYIRKRL